MICGSISTMSIEIKCSQCEQIRMFLLETTGNLSPWCLTDSFVQDNHSRSAKGALRGLHYQARHPQSKLCRVVEGEALDVVVDIRLGSPYFGKGPACFCLQMSRIKFTFRPDSRTDFWRLRISSSFSTNAEISTIPPTSTALFGTTET
jgi:hypothetical protein